MNRRLMFLPAVIGLILIGTLSFTIISADDSDTPGVAHPFASRVAQILGLDEILVSDAMKQARTELVKESMEAKLDRLVEEGKLTEEEATERLNHLIESKDTGAKRAHHKMIAPHFQMGAKAHDKKWNRDDIRAKIEEAVASGEITRQEANDKLETIASEVTSPGDHKWGYAKKHGKMLPRIDIAEKIKAAIENGDLTRKEAVEKRLNIR